MPVQKYENSIGQTRWQPVTKNGRAEYEDLSYDYLYTVWLTDEELTAGSKPIWYRLKLRAEWQSRRYEKDQKRSMTRAEKEEQRRFKPVGDVT